MKGQLCEDCRYWKKLESGWGICKKLKHYKGAIHEYVFGYDELEMVVGVGPEFGCVFFESKPKGPFYIENTDRGWVLRSTIAPEGPLIHYSFSAGAAAELRNWLNELWEKGQK